MIMMNTTIGPTINGPPNTNETTFGPPTDQSAILAMILFNKIVMIFNIYIEPVLHCFGFTANIICIVVFSFILKEFERSNRNSSAFKMFQSLLIKNICDFFINSFLILFFVSSQSILSEKLGFFIRVKYYVYLYLLPCFYLISASFDIIATIYCAISIEKKMKWLNKNSIFIILCCSFIAFPFTFQSYNFICLKLVSITFSSGTKLTLIKNFCKKNLMRLNLASSILIDIIPLCILLAINSYILFKLFQAKKRKRNIIKNNSSLTNQFMANRATNQRLKMMICLFILQVIGHFPNTIKIIVSGFFGSNIMVYSYFIHFSKFLFNFPYKFNIFIYFFFKKKFKETLLTLFNYLIKKMLFYRRS
jgi:hypothetical protein